VLEKLIGDHKRLRQEVTMETVKKFMTPRRMDIALHMQQNKHQA
jgi:hypothetical protein